MEQLLTIDILGQPFTFKSDPKVSDAKSVADYVVEAVNKVKSQASTTAPTLDKRAILILAALNITSELFSLRKEHEKLMDVINQRSKNLINAMETKLS